MELSGTISVLFGLYKLGLFGFLKTMSRLFQDLRQTQGYYKREYVFLKVTLLNYYERDGIRFLI